MVTRESAACACDSHRPARHAAPRRVAGIHKEIKQDGAYVFSRTLGDDKVVVGFVGRK